MPDRSPRERVHYLSRRRFLCALGVGGTASLLAACQPAPPPTPAAPSKPAETAKPTEATKPAAAAPTTAPAVTNAPAKPAEAPKPAAAAAEKPKTGGQLIVANWDEPITLDPLNLNGPALNVTNLIYDRLVVLD